jgi:hypothetical protein
MMHVMYRGLCAVGSLPLATGPYTVAVWATDDGSTVAPSGDPTWTMPVAVASDGPSVSIDTGNALYKVGTPARHVEDPLWRPACTCLRPQWGRGV